MKKTLFFIAASALCTLVLAQTTSNEFYKIIGETYYNTFTNSCSRNTIGFNPNTLNGAAVWTMGTSSANRGTGINYYNANNNTWGTMPNPQTGRIETVSTGWGAHGFTEEGEIVVSHNSSTGLVVNTRDIAGEGNWQPSLLKGPNYMLDGTSTTEIYWPTMITKGNTVHLVCVTGTWPSGASIPPDFEPNPNAPPHGYLGFPTLPLYYRSTDGGKTWEGPRDFRANGMTNFECFFVSADDYSIAVRGNHIVFLYYNRIGFINYMESKDGGDTWVKKTVYDTKMTYPIFEEPDAPRLFPTCASIFIDENHKVHVAFGTQCRINQPDLLTFQYYPQLAVGMIYWNDDRPPIDWHDIRGWKSATGNLTDSNWESYQGYIPVPSVVGLNKFYTWEGTEYDKDHYRNLGWAIYPNLLAKDGRVYLSYQSPLDFPINLPFDFYFRGIFITVSEDYGETWDVQNNTSWISYHPDLFDADWSNYVEPVYNPQGEPEFYPAQYVSTFSFSENAYPSMSYNYKGDLFTLQWASELFPFSYPPGFLNIPISVYSFTQDLKNIPSYKNIQEVCRGLWNGTDPAIVFPPQSCEKPTEFTATYSYDENLVNLNWEKPDYISQTLLGYNVFCNGNKINESPIPETHFQIENPELGSNHYQVSAVYSNCESNMTYGATVVVLQFCEKPVELTGIAEEADAILTWNKPDNIDGILLGYNVYRDETQINEDLSIETEYLDKNLADGTYTYQVSAVYEHCGESDLTDNVTVIIKTEAIHDLHAGSFNMYPNPTTGVLNLIQEGIEISDMRYEIFDIYGKQLSQISNLKSQISNQINISHLTAGVYFVKIFTENATVVVKKVVKM